MATRTTPPTADPKMKKRSSVRHTRAIQRDRSKRPISALPAEAVVARLTESVHPATWAQVRYFHRWGLRARLLTLPVMGGRGRGLVWRQLGGVSEGVRLVQAEAVLWVPPLRELTPQALAQRLRTLPAELFARVLGAVLPMLHARWRDRQRPLPPGVAWARARYTAVLIADGSTLDALLRKIGLRRDVASEGAVGRADAGAARSGRAPALAGLWYEADPTAHAARFGDRLLAAIPTAALVGCDLGFTDFARFAARTGRGVTWLTRAKINLVYEIEQVLVHTSAVRDRRVWIGVGATRQQVRLIEVQAHGTGYRYLTNELDLARLPTAHAAGLYRQRWRVEDAFALVKRLLGLAYFYSGAENAIEMQRGATWRLYAVLVDLTDAGATALAGPVADLSLEMVYRSLYFLIRATQQEPRTEPVRYRADHARRLGILKRSRKPRHEPPPTNTISPLTTNLIP